MKSILVIGSSRPYEKVALRAAHMVGVTLARSEFGLVSGNATGVDKAVAHAFCSELARLKPNPNRNPSERYCQLQLPFLRRGSYWPLPGYHAPIDSITHLKRSLDWEEEAISRASAAIMIGGRQGALHIARRFMDAGKSVFPIPFTGGHSGEVFQEILRTWCETPVPGLSKGQFLRLAIPWTGNTGSLFDLILGVLSETPSIFISYRREDSGSIAGRLHHDLSEHFGIKRVFMDIEHIEPSSEWEASIKHAIQECEIGVVMIGRHWDSDRIKNKEDVLRKEILQLLQSDKVVLPVMVEGAALPKELPSDLMPLLALQAHSLDNTSWNDGVTKLIRAIDKRLKLK